MEPSEIAGLDPATRRGAGNSDPYNDASPDYSVGMSQVSDPSSIGATDAMDSTDSASL